MSTNLQIPKSFTPSINLLKAFKASPTEIFLCYEKNFSAEQTPSCENDLMIWKPLITIDNYIRLV